MNDNDIVKALEICQKAKYAGDCEHMGCPARTKQGCRFYLRTDEDEDHDMVIPDEMFNASIDLIKRQKAEIERITLEYAGFQASVNHFADIGKMYSEIRAEAIKEFAERLKESAFACDVSFDFGREHCEEAVTVLEIDNLVKEMTEETP